MDFVAFRANDPLYRTFRVFEAHFQGLSDTWAAFQFLFQDEAHTAILYEAAPIAFEVFGRASIESLLAQLARLTDRKETGGHRHLCLATLLADLQDALKDPARIIPELFPTSSPIPPRAERERMFLAELDSLCAKLAPIEDKIREHRVSWVAHLDFHHAINPREEVICDLTFAEIGEAIGLIAKVLIAIQCYLWGVGASYEALPQRGPMQLLSVLELGSKAQKQLWKQKLQLDGEFPASVQPVAAPGQPRWCRAWDGLVRLFSRLVRRTGE